MGGGNPDAAIVAGAKSGLSPRGRGKHIYMDEARWFQRSIPAWAGETKSPSSIAAQRWVYPRVGGGNVPALPSAATLIGLSPRGRGKRCNALLGRLARRSIPAWAGETRTPEEDEVTIKVYPRVGGGNHFAICSAGIGAGLSPRGRGKRKRLIAYQAQLGVYPRVGGGNEAIADPASRQEGLSPRGRGKRQARA